jgi:hypothetical protein
MEGMEQLLRWCIAEQGKLKRRIAETNGGLAAKGSESAATGFRSGTPSLIEAFLS